MASLVDSERYRNAKELIEFTSSLETEEIFEAAGHPYPSRALANAVTPLVVSLANEAGVGGEDLKFTTDSGNNSQILFYGIDDTQTVLVPHILLQPTVKSAIDFVEHLKTARTMAELARHREPTMGGIIQEISNGKSAPAVATPYLVVGKSEWRISESEGCPAAKHKDLESIKPVWKDFIKWVGHLAVRSVTHHKDKVEPVFAQDPDLKIATDS